MRVPTAEQVVVRRLRAQRLSSRPVATPADIVRLLGCVQAQERDHAFFSLGLRTRAANYADVRAAFDRGEFLRTHILRPTWHFVLPDDLRWILALTSPRIEVAIAARTRQLGLDDPVIVDRSFRALTELLSGRTYLTRTEISRHFAARAGLPAPGERLGHLLMLAELRGIVCSGPIKGVQHSYALVDKLVPPAPQVDRDEAVARLVRRFFAGHGPASIADFTRWSSLTAADTRRALTEAGEHLERVVVDGVDLWCDPAAAPRADRSAPEAWLFPVYDEIVLTYRSLTFPAATDHPYLARTDPFWARVVYRGVNIGVWKRTVQRGRVAVQTQLAPSLDATARRAVTTAAHRLARFLGMPLHYTSTPIRTS